MENVIVEKALLIASRGDGPWCPVEGLREIQVEGIEDGDAIRLISGDSTLLEVKDNGVHSVNLEGGKVMLQRIAGESRVTVRAFCDR